jgi:hypothetical protein
VPPENDPEGWKTHQPAKFYAKISNARYAEIQFIFSIANPLSFARGTVIPLFLTLSSAESQALDFCSSNGTINVWLCRSVRYHMFPSHAGKIKQTGAEWREEATEFLESAVWWPAPTNDYTKRAEWRNQAEQCFDAEHFDCASDHQGKTSVVQCTICLATYIGLFQVLRRRFAI